MTNEPLSAETRKNFLYASTATVSMQMLKRGFRNTSISGVRPLNPKATRLVGPAYTLRYIPGREDLDKPPTPNDPPTAQRAAIEETPAGAVLVLQSEKHSELDGHPALKDWEERRYGRNVLLIWEPGRATNES